MTKPLFSIPTHQFLFNFNAGAVDVKFYMDTLQLEESEYNLINSLSVAYVCINVVTSGITLSFMRVHTRKNCLGRLMADNKENLGNKK